LNKNILIVAGEPSGDNIAGPLVKHILAKYPNIDFWGFGGENMRRAGVDTLCDISELSFMGFAEVVRHIPAMFNRLRILKKTAIERNCSGAILVDYPGFNLRLAERLYKANIPIVYFVSPQIWAWKYNRINIIRKCISKMLVILPFEETIYTDAGIPVKFVGHPFVSTVNTNKKHDDIRRQFGIEHGSKVLLILPGSRSQEVAGLIKPMIGAYKLLSPKIPNLKCIVARSSNVENKYYNPAENIDNIIIAENMAVEAMFISDAAITCSGSATLQCTCAGLPHVITYVTNPITAMIYKNFIRTKFIGLTNLVAGYSAVPEVLLRDATAENLASTIYPYLDDDQVNKNKRRELLQIKDKLGSGDVFRIASEEAITALSLLDK